MKSHPSRPRLRRPAVAFLLVMMIAAGAAATAAAPAAHAATGLSITDPAWTWQAPTPQGNPLEDVTFVDADNGWAVGRYGTIVHTTDGGATWISQQSGTRADLVAVTFVDGLTGWAVGTFGTIVHTGDGGLTWQVQRAPTIDEFEDVFFVTPLEGWAVGLFPGAYHTTDGGMTWTKVAFPWKHSSGPLACWFTSATTGVMGSEWGGMGIIRTTDGGATWAPCVIEGKQEFDQADSFSFVSPTEGWASGRWTLFHTTDGGASWTRDHWQYEEISDLQFSDADHGWLCSGSRVYETTDGGDTWQRTGSFRRDQALALSFTSSSSGWVVGAAGSMRSTTDGGDTWQQHATGVAGMTHVPSLTAVAFADASVGCAVGPNGAIVQTSGGGSSWAARVSGTSVPLLDVAFATPSVGYAVGARGTCLQTLDGGVTWDRLTTNTRARLIAVAAPDDTFVVTLGQRSSAPSLSICTSTDAGATWTASTLAGSARPTDMAWADRQHGWISAGSRLWQTTDGGVSWRQEYRLHVVEGVIDRLCFADAANGWAICDNGDPFLLHTTDGGATWKASHPSDRALVAGFYTDVVFTDALTGWLLVPGWESQEGPCQSAALLHTADGGKSWSAVGMGASGTVNAIAVNGGDVWAVGTAGSPYVFSFGGGGDGIILHSATRGGTPPITTSTLPSRWWHLSTNQSLTVTLSVHDSGTGVAGTWYRVDKVANCWLWDDAPTAWLPAGDGTQIPFPAPADHSGDGYYLLHYFSTDLAGTSELEHEREIVIDTLGPSCTAIKPGPVRSGATVLLRCRVADATSTYVHTTMRLLTMNGREVAHHRVSLFMVDGMKDPGRWRFHCTLPPGRYRYEVTAKDEAGNPQVKAGRSVLIVRP